MDIKHLVIAKPSGNTTAIVFDKIVEEDLSHVAHIIQCEFPSVEQVLFVQSRGGNLHGQMTGGEFCGNAVRALGYTLGHGKRSQHQFTTSGLSSPVTVHVHPGRAQLEVKIALRHETSFLGTSSVPIVHLEGISHALLFSDHPLFTELKAKASQLGGTHALHPILKQLNLVDQLASGLIFIEERCDLLSIMPFVFVRDAKTLYAETACASGSIAVAAFLDRDVCVSQPSGETLKVSLQKKGPHMVRASVDGSVNILWDGPATDLNLMDPVDNVSLLHSR